MTTYYQGRVQILNSEFFRSVDEINVNKFVSTLMLMKRLTIFRKKFMPVRVKEFEKIVKAEFVLVSIMVVKTCLL